MSNVSNEYRTLGSGKEITPAQALKELAELGEGWRLETPHELFALRAFARAVRVSGQ